MKLSLIACAALFATSLALLACSSDESRGPGPITFAGDENGKGTNVLMRGHTDSPISNRLVVDIVARGAPDLHGAALRVTWDPSALSFVEAKRGEIWSKDARAMAKEGTPGQLAVVWTEQGELGNDATAETVIGTLTFDTHGRDATSLGFKTERSQLVDRKGVKLDVKFHGGSIAAR